MSWKSMQRSSETGLPDPAKKHTGNANARLMQTSTTRLSRPVDSEDNGCERTGRQKHNCHTRPVQTFEHGHELSVGPQRTACQDNAALFRLPSHRIQSKRNLACSVNAACRHLFHGALHDTFMCCFWKGTLNHTKPSVPFGTRMKVFMRRLCVLQMRLERNQETPKTVGFRHFVGFFFSPLSSSRCKRKSVARFMTCKTPQQR